VRRAARAAYLEGARGLQGLELEREARPAHRPRGQQWGAQHLVRVRARVRVRVAAGAQHLVGFGFGLGLGQEGSGCVHST